MWADKRLWRAIVSLLQAWESGDFAGIKSEWSKRASIENDGSSTFSVSEIANLASLAARLKNQSDPVSAYLMSRFSADAHAAVTGYPEMNGSALGGILVEELNAIVLGDSIYKENRFRGVSLRLETGYFLRRNPKGGELAHLNRILLEDCYPVELSRRQNDPYSDASLVSARRIPWTVLIFSIMAYQVYWGAAGRWFGAVEPSFAIALWVVWILIGGLTLALFTSPLVPDNPADKKYIGRIRRAGALSNLLFVVIMPFGAETGIKNPATR
jgi:hypothetical protein